MASRAPWRCELVEHHAGDLEVRPGQHRQPEDGGVLLDGRLHDLLGAHADAAVDDVEARVLGRDRDHLGAVRMPVETRLADDDARTRPVRLRPGRDPGSHRRDAVVLEAELLSLDSRGGPVLAEDLAAARRPTRPS